MRRRPEKKVVLSSFLGKSFEIEKRHEIRPFGLKSDKKRQTTFSKNQRHFDPQNVKIWRFRHDMVTLDRNVNFFFLFKDFEMKTLRVGAK